MTNNRGDLERKKEDMMEKRTDVYRELQKHLDNMPIGFPESPSGLDIKLLKQRFTPEEAKIALELSAIPEPLERIHKRLKKTGISRDELEEILDHLVEKGSILGGKYFERKGPKKYYSKAQLAVGMYEFQAGRLTKEFEQDFQDYADESFYEVFHSKKTSQMRTIPIAKAVNIDRYVESYDNVRNIVRKTQKPMTVIECVCRSGKDLTEQPCKHSDIRETCLLFEDAAAFALSSEKCRIVTKDEMLGIIDRAEEAGFVLQPENNQNPNFICCCCGCCCNVLTSVKRFPKPAEYYHSNYYSAVNSEKCEACQTCVDMCPMAAISADEGVAAVNLDRCIGCGVCVSKCTAGAIELKEKESKYVPPKDSDAMYKKILMERIGVKGMLKMMPKMLLGKKI
jgi:H+/Na+-translocating ferredoxin:NAD+ oxidoreductase subunit B